MLTHYSVFVYCVYKCMHTNIHLFIYVYIHTQLNSHVHTYTHVFELKVRVFVPEAHRDTMTSLLGVASGYTGLQMIKTI